MPPRAFTPRFGEGFGGPVSHGTLILKVGTVGADPHWQDGDIINAINRRRTRQVHGEHLCHPAAAGFNGDGLRPLQSLAQRWLEAVSRYRFTRVSDTEVERFDLVTLGAEIIGPTPNARGEVIDVPGYIARRRRHARHRLFGTIGAEMWYGGEIDVTHAGLDRGWAAIEEHSAFREIDFPDWPAGLQELKSHLLLRVDDFDDADGAALEAPVVDGEALVRKRGRGLAWRNLPGMSTARIAQIEDRAVSVDIRGERKHPRAPYLVVKA